jgi:O-succinylbenzoic acid--CoA ligase
MINVLSSLRLFHKSLSDSPFLIEGETVITYRNLNERMVNAIYNLRALWMTPNTRVAIYSPTCGEYLITLMALWRLEITTCLLNTRMPVSKIWEQCSQLNCSLLICHPRHKDLFAQTLENSNQTIVLDLFELCNKWADQSKHLFFRQPDIPLDQEVTIMFTSGSRDHPKAVLHTYGNHFFNALGSNGNIPVREKDRWLLSLPIYHVGGFSILFRVLLGHGTLVIPSEEENLLESIQRYSITQCSLVPTQLYRLINSTDEFKLKTQLNAVLVGGGPIPEILLETCKRKQWPIYVTYGLTEMSSQVATSTSFDLIQNNLLAGKVLEHRELRLAQDGEILVRGKTLFKGYVNDKAVTLPLNPEGWFATGDLGILVDGSRLQVIGRKDNMFISGGENIQPEQIEKCLTKCAGVEQAIVIPIPNQEYGLRPVAFLKLREEANHQVTTYTSVVQSEFPRFMIPDKFYYWPDEKIGGGIKVRRQHFIDLIQSNPAELKEIN